MLDRHGDFAVALFEQAGDVIRAPHLLAVYRAKKVALIYLYSRKGSDDAVFRDDAHLRSDDDSLRTNVYADGITAQKDGLLAAHCGKARRLFEPKRVALFRRACRAKGGAASYVLLKKAARSRKRRA